MHIFPDSPGISNACEASHKLDGERPSIGPIAVTAMACEAPAGIIEPEASYLAALESVSDLTQLGGALKLMDAGGEALLLLGAP